MRSILQGGNYKNFWKGATGEIINSYFGTSTGEISAPAPGADGIVICVSRNNGLQIAKWSADRHAIDMIYNSGTYGLHYYNNKIGHGENTWFTSDRFALIFLYGG